MAMIDVSILIGGKAGVGIDKAGMLIAGILNRLGLKLYIYRDYPSIIRGGHTFSIIRASTEKILSHSNHVDFILALNQDTVNFHNTRLKDGAVTIYDSSSVKADGLGVDIAKIIAEENASEIMRNSCVLGSFCKAAGVPWEILEQVFAKNFSQSADINLKVARRGFDAVEKIVRKIESVACEPLPLLTGNEAIGLGFVKAGLDAYVAYPMTPSSGILHFLASEAGNFGLKVIHPESEIGVILMALGFAYAGQKAAVGTSGGGFCLMTEALSLSGMAELPVAIVVGQRPGPSTGLPTYTSQTELNFVLNAGHGEFSRLVVAPGDSEEAYYWAGVSLNLAWKYQIPALILTDKTLAEGVYSFDKNSAGEVKTEQLLVEGTGISPTHKVNSYEHDDAGISTEDPGITVMMQERRLRKEKDLLIELKNYDTIKLFGNMDSTSALLCWGSNKGVCCEVAKKLGLKVIHIIGLWPFDGDKLKAFLGGVKNLICVENNATAQLACLVKQSGVNANKNILKYDGRPFSVDELEQKVKEALQ